MEIRKVTLTDVDHNEEQIRYLFQQICQANYPDYLNMQTYVNSKPDEMRQYIKDGSAILFGSFENDLMTGLIWGYEKNYFGERRLHIAHTVVDEAWRHTMAHLALVKHLMEEAKQRDISVGECMVTYGNERLVSYYEHLGFEIERVIMVKRKR